MKYAIHWFRRDLRIAGNIALRRQFEDYEGHVLGLFCFDKKFLSRDDFSTNRFQFFLESLKSLKSELRTLGSDLLVLDTGPFEAFPELLETLQKAGKALPERVSFSRDYEPFARNRDAKLLKMFEAHDIESLVERDHLLIEPEELYRNRPEEGYQVYSPFARKWLEISQSPEVQNRLRAQASGLKYLEKLDSSHIEAKFQLRWTKLLSGEFAYPDHLSEYLKENQKNVSVPIPKAGSLEAFRALKTFKAKINNYGARRDFPADSATSKFSMYLKNGSLSIPQVIAYLNLKPYKKKASGRDVFFSELIWREFYYHILYRHPNVETQSFIEKFRKLKWPNNKTFFKAWKKGTTGFPIVDAGMRELNTTGWMHNRVRMIVASFLTKDLLVDWRWGEKYFMEKLLDGDLAPNNGGWQWAASTGCDPQPYFRIFNPWLQSQKFDPEGLYIKKFIPELKDLPTKALHAPILGHSSYPEPIVDHKIQRGLALALYKVESDSKA